jgi:hypothetical protein
MSEPIKNSNRPRRFAALARSAAMARKMRLALECLVDWLSFLMPGSALLFLLALLLPPEQIWSALMCAAAVIWTGVTFIWRFAIPFFRSFTGDAYLVWLEKRAGLERNQLINALHLERDQAKWHDDAVSRELVQHSVDRGIATLKQLDLRKLHARQPLLPRFALTGAGLAPFILIWLLAPYAFDDAFDLFLQAGRSSVVPMVSLSVDPGDQKIERGGSVQIHAAVSGRRRPGGIEIEMRREGGDWISAAMNRLDATGDENRDDYGFLAGGLKADLEYRVAAGWASSATYRIKVVEKLQALGYRKIYEAPEYTGMAPLQEVSSNGDLSGLEGSLVTLNVRHRRPGADGQLLFDPAVAPARGEPITIRIPLHESEPGILSAQWLIDRDGSYHVELQDNEERDFWASDTFHIATVPDLSPAVRLLSPGPEIEMPPDMYVALIIDCVDDFGLSDLCLIYGREGDDPTRVTLMEWDSAKEARITYDWNLDDVNILPGQEIYYYLQVSDNDILHGPKIGETDMFKIRFPSLAEMYSQADEEREEEVVTMAEAMENQERLSEDLQRIAQEMLRDDNISWEREQEVRDLLERQSSMGEKIEQLQESLNDSQERMENQNLFSMEMIEKVQQIQNLVESIQSDEFHEMVKNMNQAMENMDQKEIQKALEEMKISQEEVSQALDRTLEMLRDLMQEEKLDRIMQKMDELLANQEEINKQLEMGLEQEDQKQGDECKPGENSPADSDSTAAGDCENMSDQEAADMAARQEEIKKQLEELRKELAALSEQCKQDGNNEMAKALEQMLEEQSDKKALEEMKKAMEAMAEQKRSPALKFGRQAKSEMDQMSASMGQCKRDVDLEKLEALARSLFNIANRMVRASKLQEELAINGNRLGPLDMAVLEQELYTEVKDVGDSLMAVARETPVVTPRHLRAIREVLDKIAGARDQMEAGRRVSGLSLVSESSRALNSACKGLLEAANQTQQQCSSSSSCMNPFNQMQKLSNQQDALNQQTQQSMSGMQMPRPSMSKGESMMRMAARQEMIKQGIEELGGQFGGESQMGKELGNIASEMEEIVEELKNRKADRKLIARQEEILSRLLQAQRSERRRDESRRRRSQVGVAPLDLISPDAIRSGESLEEMLKRALLRGAKDPVPAEYRRMVDRYMRTLLRSNP